MAKISLNPQKNPIIDTTLLFEFLLWRFYEEVSGGEKPGSPPAYSYQYLPDWRTRHAFLWYISKAKPIETSPHVIAEIHGLAKRARMVQPRLGIFWKFAQGELAQLRLEERFVPLEEMGANDLQYFGPADTSLLQRARTSGKALLTGEREIGKAKDVRILTSWDLLALWEKEQC